MEFAAKKRISPYLLVVVLLVAVANAQWLEDTIVLRDSIGFLRQPQCLAYCPLNGRLYVGGTGDDILAVIDCATNQRVAWIDLPRAAAFIVNANNVRHVFCTNNFDDLVAIDVLGDTIAWTKTIPGNLRYLLYEPERHMLYCANGATLVTIDALWDTVVASTTLGTGIRHPVYCSSSDRVLCPAYNTDTVFAMDAATNTRSAAVRVDDQPYWLLCHPSGEKVYCSCRWYGVIYVIDPYGQQVLTTIPAGDRVGQMCFDSGGSKLYCANYLGNSVTVVDCAADSVLKTIRVAERPGAIMYNPINHKVYCTHALAGLVTIISTETDTVISTIPVGLGPVAMAWVPTYNRTYVACEDGRARVAVIRDVTGIEEQVQPGPAQPWATATVARATLRLPGSDPAVLLNSAGRVVATLSPGANNVGLLPRGVYFLSYPQARTLAPQKVLLVR